MNTIAYIGMDVHTTNYTLCGFTAENDIPFGRATINPEMTELEKYLNKLHERKGLHTSSAATRPAAWATHCVAPSWPTVGKGSV